MDDIKEQNKQYLISKLKHQYDENIVEKILRGYETKRNVSIRINTIKASCEDIEQKLKNAGIDFQTVSWSNTAFIIKNKTETELQGLEIYNNGEIYLQNLSSMLPPIILEPKENEDILDMAAAPGGKTTQIAALTKNNANITACEMNAIRLERLKYNIEKQSANSVYIMKKDARDIDNFFSFDRILLDAPCSGSGTLDFNNEKTFQYFSKKLVEKSSKTQLTLLRKALKILKPGKELVYSTCSILAEENEDIINTILKEVDAEIIPIDFMGKDEIELLPTKIQGTMCVAPNEFYEGFFVAKIRKIK